ncbi:MAG: hypothetical protein L3J63_06870 [Geopsychrobacter sp.]|nr:hypothetical protein [Geopsychrobacter sp.]
MTDKEKAVKLYNAVNKMMAFLGMEGHITTRSALVEDVMSALYEIDDGEFATGAMEKLLNKIENEPDERQEALF